MLCEGLGLAVKTSALSIHLHGKRKKQQKLTYLCTGWGISFLIVMISVGYTIPLEIYMDKLTRDPDCFRVCWVGSDNDTVLYSVVIPFAIVISINLAILSRSGCYVYKMSKETDRMRPQLMKNEHSHIFNSIKAVTILIPTLGLTWTFAFLISKYYYRPLTRTCYLKRG